MRPKRRKPVSPSTHADELLRIANTSPFNTRVIRLLRALSRAVHGQKYVVGGGVAVVSAGYLRNTMDVDVFAAPKGGAAIAAALRGEGMVVHSVTDSHIVAFFEDDNIEFIAARQQPEYRIDLLVAISEPETSSIRTAQVVQLAELPIAVMRTDYLVAMKLLLGRPKDLLDAEEIARRGAVDLKRVHYLISVSDPDHAAFERLTALHRSLAAPRPNPTYQRYLDRESLAAWYHQPRWPT
jgi:hypothetical protein